ncbi:MAG: chromosome segregation protein SMC [Actinomycetota bacterium]|nr:chromosome segregation protein SMC [Actinomycetota bacterium]
MFLKSLTMKGFKSFADPTVLEFEPGVTVVVGPNGSGKSNVVDAVAWVLGAQGPTTVRSGKMEDVVFAGTPDRPALGRAEVSLVIDNSSGSLPIEFTEVTVTRTLYRSGDSEYSLNDVPCRLLDIQELLSDAGVGRQQHVIVAQGQIDQVLNSRPEERRAIVEEAAGILKFRRRKERAERRLAATETNLTRLQDLQREVRRQLRPLEKQADAAKRHGAVVDELRSIRLFLTGQEIRSIEAAQTAAKDVADETNSEQVRLRGDIGVLDIEIRASESQLAAAGDPSTDLLPRVESLRERCRGLIALIEERSRTTERDRGVLLAADVALTLQAESSRLAEELDDLSTLGVDVARQLEELLRVDAQLTVEAESIEVDGPLVGLDAAKRAAEVKGELGPLERGLESVTGEHARLTRRVEQLTKEIAEADERLEHLQLGLVSASDAEPALVQDLDEALKGTEVAEQRMNSVTEEQLLAGKDEQTWRARVEALEIAAETALKNSGFPQVQEIDGVLGVLAELIEIEPGWEPAVEAAIGGVLTSVVVEDVETARTALEQLGRSDVPGSILAIQSPYNHADRPEFTDALRERVSGKTSQLEILLDSLLSTAVCVQGGWSEAIDIAVQRPGLTVVTSGGDCFGPGGWNMRPGEKASTATALNEARDHVQVATARREAAQAERTVVEADLLDARRRHEEAVRRLETNDDLLTRSADGIEKVQRSRRDLTSEREILGARVDELGQTLGRDRPRLVELEARLVELEAAESLERSAASEAHTQRRELERRMRVAAQSRAELEANQKALQERERRANDRREEITAQLKANDEETKGKSHRLLRIEESLGALAALRDLLQKRFAVLDREVGNLRAKRTELSAEVRSVADRLETLRGERSSMEKKLAETQEIAASNELAETERRFKIDSLREMLRNELNADQEEALATPEPSLEESSTPTSRVRELESDLRRMGPINPLALQEHEALKERHDFVAEQLDDVRSGRRELNKVIAAVDAEIVDVFAAAFKDVADNFGQIFSTLFPGGEGRLTLSDPDQMLGTGIELEAKPSGKNVRKLSLLSGGERSLTALAFLFAIFRSRPSPFYVMDEVEAALDDINLHRFLELVSEFREEAQLVIVSHQKRTMEAADVLYGISMASGGSSQVLSEKVAS